ncbi:MAG: hypothetical protein ACI4R8_05210, partial [Candidatus Caccovivens sp.]
EATGDGLKIVQQSNLGKFIAGLGFGEINADTTISSTGTFEAKLVGRIEQIVTKESDKVIGVKTSEAELGGLAGLSSSNVKVNGLSIDFSVGKAEANYDDGDKNEFDKNETDYNNISDASSFEIGTGDDNSIGGLIGFVNGGKVSVAGKCNIDGTIDVLADKVSVGGIVGKIISDFESTAYGKNNLNIAVTSSDTAYVGGIIGNVASTTGSNRSVYVSASSDGFETLGTLLSNAQTLKFGGAIGYVGLTDFGKDAVSVSNTHFGGAVKVYGKDNETSNSLNGAKVSVGGVIGEFAIDSKKTYNGTTAQESKFEISDCVSYGDVFVNYKTISGAEYYNYKLSEYNFGGIVGKASAVKISNCISIMTNFNDRLTNTYSAESTNKGLDNIGAIFGSGAVVCDGNKYSSGVCLTYQKEDGNTDLAYGSPDTYFGYTSKVTYDAENEYSGTNDDILGSISTKLKVQEYQIGHKLNPYVWTKDSTQTVDELSLTDFNGISWLALKEDVSIESPIADNFVNVAFVGNGHTITSTLDENVANDTAIFKGGVVNQLGNDEGTNFSILSGFVLDLNVNVDLNTTTNDASSLTHAFGGVAGKVTGHSFIYGVGVRGDLSVGGSSTLQLGGIAGTMEYGYINECYVDAEISYRAESTGQVSGIANFGQYNTTVKATYSSGMIETYNAGSIYTFAYANSDRSGNDTNRNTADIVDCYSITQIKEDMTLTDESANKYFVNSGVIPIGNVLNGCYEVPLFDETNQIKEEKVDRTEFYKQFNYKPIDKLSILYSSASRAITDSIYSPDYSGADKSNGYSTWYFTPFTNYGYASHGFGYLRNVTTYTRTANSQTNEEGVAVVDAEGKTVADGTYSYSAVSYSDVLKYQDKMASSEDEEIADNEKWFLGVPNQGKFEQMIGTVNKQTYDKEYRFVLRYSLDMSKFNAEVLGSNVGVNDKDFVLDGNDNTLDFSNVKEKSRELFNQVAGVIENLRISDINAKINNLTASFGALANKVCGNLKNVTVTGNINNVDENAKKANAIGGVVGILQGNADNVNAVVNINTTKGGIVGGIVGELYKNASQGGEISNSSNAGMIVVIGSGTTGKSFKAFRHLDNSITEGISLSTIAGGVVGYMETGTSVTESYNANAVLANFTIGTSYNSVAGGIAGYAQGTISNSYNTGFVGAGNYSSTSSSTNPLYNLAGGIFGYGSGLSISGCINDGAVQAIGQASTSGPEISIVEKTKGTIDNVFTNEPTNREYNVTITYNSGSYRQVYAYGLGFGSNLTFGTGDNSNYTSTDNIKNDGNIGEISETKVLTLDRKTMIDNNDGKLPFWASFSADKTVYVNGYDSYGYASRVYIKDTMTRVYSYLNTSPSLTEAGITNIKNNITSLVDEQWNGGGVHQGTYQQSYEYVKVGEDKDKNDIYGWDKTNPLDYSLSGTTTYASYVEFSGYDAILLGNSGDGYLNNNYNNFGLVGFDISKTKIENRTIANAKIDAEKNFDISTKIAELDENKEKQSKIKEIVVEGNKSIAVVSSAGNLKAILAPHSATVSVDLTLDNISDGDWDNLSENDFTISNVMVGQQEKVVQYYEITSFSKNDNDKTVTLAINLYFSEEIENGEITVGISYMTHEFDYTLGLNNMIYKDGQTYIFLPEFEGQLSSEIVNAINNKSVIDNKKYSFTAQVDGVDDITSIGFMSADDLKEIENFENIEGYENGLAYLIAEGNQTSAWNEKTLNFNLKIEEYVTYSYDTKLKTTESSANFNVESATSQTYTFIGYETYALGKFIGYDSNNYNSDIITNQYLDLEKLRTKIKDSLYLGFTVDKLAFGSGDSFVNYNGTWWISSSDIQITDDNKIDISSFGDIHNWDVYFKNTLQQAKSFKFEKTTYSTSSPFKLTVTSSAQQVDASNGYFDKEGYYQGADFESVASVEGLINNKTVNHFGMDFHEIDVTYEYAISEIKLKNTGNNLGYTLKTTDDSQIKQGYLLKDAEVSLGTTWTAFTVSYNATDKKIVTNENDSEIEEDFTSEHKFNLTDSLTLTTKDKKVSYYISNEEIDASKNNNDASQIEDETLKELLDGKYVSTSYSNIDTNNNVSSYLYKIYENGTISVEYTFGQVDNDRITYNDAQYRTFVYDTKNNKFYEMKYQTDGNGNLIKDEEEKPIISISDDYIKSENLTYLNSYSVVTVDVVVAGLSENEILFAKNEIGDLYTKSQKTAWNELSNDDDGISIKLYSNLTSKFTVSDDDKMIDGTFEYSQDNENSQDKKNEKNWTTVPVSETEEYDPSITATDFGAQTYYYRYQRNVQETIYQINSIKVSSATNSDGVTLKNDISFGMFTGSGFDNKVKINGNGFVLRYANNKQLALFNKNFATIKDLKIVVNSSLSVEGVYVTKGYKLVETPIIDSGDISEKDDISSLMDVSVRGVSTKEITVTKNNPINYGVIKENTGALSNIDLYGNIRNILMMETTEAGSYQTVDTFVLTNNGTIKNTTSHISVNGLDGSGSGQNVTQNVTVQIQDNLTDESPANEEENKNISQNLLIAGNGLNGKNGSNGNASRLNAYSGKNGGKGGTINVSSAFEGYARAGIGGFAGYGGNGANGYYDFTKKYVHGGGAPGLAGENGAAGSVSGTKVLSTRSVNKIQSRGNGGVGGVGRIVGNTLCTGSKSGGFKDNEIYDGSNGTSITWINSNNNVVTFGYAKDVTFKDSGHNMDTFVAGVGHTVLIDHWKANIDAYMKKNEPKHDFNTIYTSSKVGFVIMPAFVPPYHEGAVGIGYSKVIWTSGEMINGYNDAVFIDNTKLIAPQS